jgi:hypothetical protein
LKITDIQRAVEPGFRHDSTHEPFERRIVVERMPKQELPGRRSRQMAAQMLDYQQLRTLTGGENTSGGGARSMLRPSRNGILAF